MIGKARDSGSSLMSYIRHLLSYVLYKTSTYPQVIQSKMIAIKVIHMPLQRVLRHLEWPNVLTCSGVLNKDIHRVSGCYHFYPQAVDNYNLVVCYTVLTNQ